MKFNKILVPIDFSEYSERAFSYALAVSGQFGSQLTLVNIDELFRSVYPEDGMQLYNPEETVRKRIELIQSQLQKYIQRAAEKNIPATYAIVRGDSVSEKLLEHIGQNQYDMVVMGTHGRTGLKHVFLGSIAEKIVRLSPAPVLTIHECVDCFKVKKILVPIDFSAYSLQALEYAKSIANSLGAEITVMHVIERVIYPAFYPEGYYPLVDFEPKLQGQMLESLDTFLKQIPDFTADKVVTAGRPSDEIVQYAGNNKFDLVIMATRGLSGLQHLIVGSTAERIVRLSPIPVLTVRSEYEELGGS